MNAWALSDGFFVAGLMMAGVGALVLVASTGFFDMFSYAFHSLLVLFTPLRNPKNHETFYEYKMARDHKRAASMTAIFAVGVVYLLVSLLCLFLYYTLAA